MTKFFSIIIMEEIIIISTKDNANFHLLSFIFMYNVYEHVYTFI